MVSPSEDGAKSRPASLHHWWVLGQEHIRRPTYHMPHLKNRNQGNELLNSKCSILLPERYLNTTWKAGFGIQNSLPSWSHNGMWTLASESLPTPSTKPHLEGLQAGPGRHHKLKFSLIPPLPNCLSALGPWVHTLSKVNEIVPPVEAHTGLGSRLKPTGAGKGQDPKCGLEGGRAGTRWATPGPHRSAP